jgi:single-strand DNA-binding protein
MGKDLNKVQVTGRLGADPELRQTPQGHTVITFRVASNRSWRSADGEPHEETEWFRVVAWNRLAEICQQYLLKGSRVYIEGRLQTREWQDQEGKQHTVSEVIASDMIILGRREPPAPRVGDAQPALSSPRAARVAPLPRGQAPVAEGDLPF